MWTHWWKKGPSDKGQEKSQGTQCLFWISFYWLVLPSGLAGGPWASCGTGATPAVKEDILEALEPNWSHGRRKDQTGCTSGFWGRLPMLHHWNIMVIRAGSWWLENLKCHTHLHGGQEEDPGSYKPHLYPWERYRAKLLEAIASYMMDKAAANIPYGFTRSDSADKEGEDGKCCTLWL